MAAHTIDSVMRRVESILAGQVSYDDSLVASDAQQLRNEVRKHERDTGKGKSGNCLVVAYLLARLEQKTLIHALLNPAPHTRFHAWVAFGSIYVDLTAPIIGARYRHKDAWPYPIVQAKRYRGVSRLCRLLTDNQSYGPWEPAFQDEQYFTD